MTTPLDQENALRLAVMEVEWKHVKATIEDLKFSNARQDAKLDTVLTTLTQAKGGWRALMWVGGVATTLGGGIGWILSHWKG